MKKYKGQENGKKPRILLPEQEISHGQTHRQGFLGGCEKAGNDLRPTEAEELEKEKSGKIGKCQKSQHPEDSLPKEAIGQGIIAFTKSFAKPGIGNEEDATKRGISQKNGSMLNQRSQESPC